MDVTTYAALPETDYKNGKLRAVRGRMVKKLLKYEWKAISPTLIICGIVLAALTLFICFFGRAGFEFLFQGSDYPVEYPATTVLATILTIAFYAVTLIVVACAPIGISISRYYKNFFKEEGYLTFSIPASMEEHILAKHLSGILAMLVSIAANFLSVMLVVMCMSGYLGEIPVDPITPVAPTNPISDLFLAIEGLIMSAETLVGIFTVSGALCCWGQKFKKKSHIFWRLLLAYIVFMILETVFMLALEVGTLDFFYTLAGTHVSNVLTILFYAGIIALSVWYELRTLKKKLNLK